MANEPDIVQNTSVDVTTSGNLSVGFEGAVQQIDVQSEVVQQLSVNFNVVNDLNISLDNVPQQLDAQFGTVYIISGDCKVLYATTATWNSQPLLISARGYIYIYSDYKQNEQEQNIAGFKVGDGKAYLIDLPFTDEQMQDHISDTVAHITQEERDKWNNKVRCYVSDIQDDNLIFTTD